MINVAILDDHQSIIDGYLFRLNGTQDIKVTATLGWGEEVEPSLAEKAAAGTPIDVLILDVSVPTSPQNNNPYPILYLVPRLLDRYPELKILIITMHLQRTLINSVLEAGASGYILKEDGAALRDLAGVVRSIANGAIFISQAAMQELMRRTGSLAEPLSPRQLEALSYLATYPNASTADLAKAMNVAHSTVRNLLSTAYVKLGVTNRTAAILEARHRSVITPQDVIS
jgi:two-component system, NarL family, nitrate/nitrite response regulator NarL